MFVLAVMQTITVPMISSSVIASILSVVMVIAGIRGLVRLSTLFAVG